MKVADIMTKKVIYANPNTKVTEVADIMFKNRFHGIPILEKEKIVGIITETDFFTRDSSNTFLPSYINFINSVGIADQLSKEQKEKIDKLLEAKAGDIMNPHCTTISPDMDIHDLMEFFKETKFITLPVTDKNEKLVGIVTLTDIIGLINKKLEL